MGYTVVKSFERGLDTRRLLECIEPGHLLDAVNVHVTRGGELEKRAAWVVEATLPATTMGFFANESVNGTVFHTFGDALTVPAGMPANGVYHAVPHPLGFDLVAIMKVEDFMGKLYVVAQYEGGRILHWWGDSFDADGVPTPPLMSVIVEYVPPPPEVDGTPIDPPPPTDPGAKPTTTMEWHYAGTTGPFAWGGAFLVSPNTGSGRTVYGISSFEDYTVNANGMVPIPYGDGSGNNIAAIIAQTINTIDTTGAPVNVVCYAEGRNTRFVINEASAFYNGWTISIGASLIFRVPPGAQPHSNGNYSAYVDTNFPLTGGKNPIVPSGLKFPGTYAGEDDTYPPGTPVPLTALGTFALAHNEKMYAVNEQMLNFSAVQNAARWDAGTSFGAGAHDHTAWMEGHPVLVSMADYGGDLAVFGSRHIIIWITDPLPERYQKKQVLHRTGTIAPHSVKSYGLGDVMYLDRSGVRSLRAREGFDIAYASDIGIMIDRLVREQVATLTVPELFHNIWAEIEPNSGRLWMCLKDKIFVLSNYPAERISAWTVYDVSDAPVDMMNSTVDQIYWRSGNNVMSYGGAGGATYDDTEAMARLPYVDGGKPATHKSWTGIDAALYGTWQIRGSFDPTVPTAFDLLANVTKSTYAQQKIAMNGMSPAVSLELRSTFVGPARVGNATLHYEASTAD